MSTYTSNIILAAALFPVIAFIITIPYMIYQYRRYGSIPWLHTLMVYALVFYLMCAYFLVLLPLPENHSIVVPYAQTPQLMPFNFVREFLAETTFSFADPTTWLKILRDPYVYEAIFNVLLLVPLGMFLRYYARRTWWQTLIIGFLVTLSFELTQLTGLWGIYAHPYRLFDVDDLILNTLGAMVGFWIAGPVLRILPDMRLVSTEAQARGLHASVTRRALSFGIDLVIAQLIAVVAALAALFVATVVSPQGGELATFLLGAELLGLAVSFFIIPAGMHGQTLGQKLLRLRIVRPDASPARWYQIVTRYGLLFLLVALPFVALTSIFQIDVSYGSEMSAVGSFAAKYQQLFVIIWLVLMALWFISLCVRALRTALTKCPFVMANGLLSNTRVMTESGIEAERERRATLDVAQVGTLERMIAADGIPLAELMNRAGCALADEVRAWVPNPAPVVVLAGSGNNGGDGWVAARELALANYHVTLITADLAEHLHAEPARTTALAVFADASERNLPLHVLIAPDSDVLSNVIDKAEVILDALLGTGFQGDEVREPYASWIKAANVRRFEGNRGKGGGRHRRREHEQSKHVRNNKKLLQAKVKHAPFALAADVPSGLSAQSGMAARTCFAADMTLTLLAYKPGLVVPTGTKWTGVVKLAKLVETKPYLRALRQDGQPDD